MAFEFKNSIKNKKTKVTAGLLSTGGVLGLVLNLNAAINGRFEKIDEKIKAAEGSSKEFTREYSGLVIQPLHSEIKNLKETQKEIKGMLKDLHKVFFNK